MSSDCSQAKITAPEETYCDSTGDNLGPGLSFSWKRALGVTKAKRRVSKATGIPLTRGGRRMKPGKWLGMK